MWELPWWPSDKESASQCGRHIPVQEDSTGTEQVSLCANIFQHHVQLLRLCSRAWEPQLWSPRARVTEAHTPWGLRPTSETAAMRSQHAAEKSNPTHSLQLQKSCTTMEVQHSQKHVSK